MQTHALQDPFLRLRYAAQAGKKMPPPHSSIPSVPPSLALSIYLSVLFTKIRNSFRGIKDFNMLALHSARSW